ncbi:MAG: substrate-binding domain-containing protein [Betaproteobacteria bacterium]
MPATSAPGQSSPAVKILSSMAVRRILVELAADYETRHGTPVAVESVGGVDVAKRVRRGEAADIVVLASDAIGDLAGEGRLDPSSRVDVARSPIAVAVPAGAAHPDLSSEAAVRQAVMAARRIAYSTGPSGRHLVALLERWRDDRRQGPQLVEAPPGVAVGTLVARGDADVGIQQLSELMALPGIDIVGRLPTSIQSITVFAGALCVASSQVPAARAVLAFCASEVAASAKRRNGMEP